MFSEIRDFCVKKCTFKNFGIKGWLISLILLLLVTNILIFFNIPFLREFAAFIYFTTVPGILILHILRLNKIEFLKKMVLGYGLSIAFIIFVGLGLNSAYPFILKPLSLMHVLISFNVILIILTLAAYIRNKDDFSIHHDFLNFKTNLKGKIISILIFPALFPFMAIFGTHMMNTMQNNVILLSMLFLIPLYIISIGFSKDRVHKATYPFALWMISLSLLLMYGLTSNYIMGRDVHNEFRVFKLTLDNLHWNMMDYFNPYNACMSITILPTIYKVLSAMNEHYIFKLFFAVIGSIIPLTVYIVAKKYINEKYAFFAALLFVFQLFFLNSLGAVRQVVATLFFFLTVMIFFSADLNRFSKKFLFLIFIFSLVVSHYTTAYVSFVFIVPILLIPFLKGLFKERKIVLTNFDLILISFGFVTLWYILFAYVQFSAGTQVVQTTIMAATDPGNVSAAVSRGDYVLGILGIRLTSVPNAISVIVHNMVFATMLTGIIGILWKFRYYREKFETEFLAGIAISIILLVLFVLLPYISVAYDAARLFFQLLIFLAPVFIIGAIRIAKFIKKPKWNVAIILILLISLFSCTTYLQYHFYGMPYSATFDEDGIRRAESFIYQSELAGAEWLKDNRLDDLVVYSDSRALFRFNIAGLRTNINSSLFALNKTVDSGYIYLGKVNIDKNELYMIYDRILILNLKDFKHLFLGKQRIYDSGGSQIWF